MSTTLPLFWNLSSANKKERLDASVKLVGALEKLQASFTPNESSPESAGEPESGVEDEDEEDGGHDDVEEGQGKKEQGPDIRRQSEMLNQLNAGDVSYSIRRLVRGLASPRESSRLGFAVALTEVRTLLIFSDMGG
jgi:DNA polymerase phi